MTFGYPPRKKSPAPLPPNLDALKADLSRSYATKLSELAATLDGQTDVKAMATAAPMASPPTFTYSATTTLTGSVLAAHNDTRFRTSGAETYTLPISTTNFLAPKAPIGADVPFSAHPWRVEFDFDGAAFELVARCAAEPLWRVWVDGKPHGAPNSFTVTDRSVQNVKVNFGTRAYRRIVLEGESNFYFGGIRHLPTDTIAPPATQKGPLLAVAGDSYVVAKSGAGNISMLGYVPVMARQLGFRDFTQTPGVGGTGYVQGNGNYPNYQGRITDVTGIKPDVVLVQGSINDTSATAAQVKTNATTYIKTLKTALPNALVVMVGTINVSSNGATFLSHIAAQKEVAAEQGVAYISPLTFFTGNGNVTTPNGTGNADYYRASDNSHPSPAGHVYLGNRMVAGMQRVLKGEMVIA